MMMVCLVFINLYSQQNISSASRLVYHVIIFDSMMMIQLEIAAYYVRFVLVFPSQYLKYSSVNLLISLLRDLVL